MRTDRFSGSAYYPFGMMMPGDRKDIASTHRYGFQGKEHDPELKGKGNSSYYRARIYDPRLGRWMSQDPLNQFIGSQYSGMANNPIWAVDYQGGYVYIVGPKGDRQKLKTAMNLIYETEVGRNVLKDYIGNENKHIFISIGKNFPEEETEDTKEEDKGYTIYPLNGRPVSKGKGKGFEDHQYYGGEDPHSDTYNKWGKVGVELEEGEEPYNREFLQNLMHEIGAHVYMQDQKDIDQDGSDDDPEHKAWGYWSEYDKRKKAAEFQHQLQHVERKFPQKENFELLDKTDKFRFPEGYPLEVMPVFRLAPTDEGGNSGTGRSRPSFE